MNLSKPRKPRQPNKYQKIVSKFCHTQGWTRYEWAREMKIAVFLFGLYPDEDFWGLTDRPPFIPSKLPSLAYFKTPEGSRYLKSEYSTFSTSLKRREDYTKQPVIGEKVEIARKPKTALEFLNLDYGKS